MAEEQTSRSRQPLIPRVKPQVKRFLADYAWFIVRNVVGWILILAAPPLGVILPGPGGLPVFLIGFALVTFPGKRRLTARMLRGRRLAIEHRAYAMVAALFTVIIPGVILWVAAIRYQDEIRRLISFYAPQRIVYYLVPLLLMALTWLVTRLSFKMLNLMLMFLPIMRRRMRPWLRRRGFDLLPPRRQKQSNEILEIDPSYGRGARRVLDAGRP